uniref:Ribosomal_L28e domain-containing protein n=1 Tax=Gongylonema pulchrum TaxID=637853 RepID=A0A183EYW1_9BILA
LSESVGSDSQAYEQYTMGPTFTRAVLPPDAKVLMLMKPNVPGEKQRLVKLEPVANPAKPDFRFAFETLRKTAKKTDLRKSAVRTRKRRIIRSQNETSKVRCFPKLVFTLPRHTSK